MLAPTKMSGAWVNGSRYSPPLPSFSVPTMTRCWKLRSAAWASVCAAVQARASGLPRRQILSSGVSFFHFGWACVADRQARYDRYVEHDGGAFHASRHLQSIMWPDDHPRIGFCRSPWPAGLDVETILGRVG